MYRVERIVHVEADRQLWCIERPETLLGSVPVREAGMIEKDGSRRDALTQRRQIQLPLRRRDAEPCGAGSPGAWVVRPLRDRRLGIEGVSIH